MSRSNKIIDTKKTAPSAEPKSITPKKAVIALRYSEDFGSTMRALDCLLHLSGGEVNNFNPKDPTRAELARSGVCDVLLDFIGRFATDAALIAILFALSKNLARNEEVRLILGSLGLCETAIAALREYKHNVVTAREILSAIRNLCHQNKDNHKRFIVDGCIEATIETMQCNATDEMIAENGCVVIYLLCPTWSFGIADRKANRQRLASSGGFQIVEAVLRTFYNNACIVYYGGVIIREWLSQGHSAFTEWSPQSI